MHRSGATPAWQASSRDKIMSRERVLCIARRLGMSVLWKERLDHFEQRRIGKLRILKKSSFKYSARCNDRGRWIGNHSDIARFG